MVDCDIEGEGRRSEGNEGKHSKRMMERGKRIDALPPPSGKCDEGKKKGGTAREYIAVQSRRRRAIGNEDRDSAEKDVGAIKDDSPFNS